MARHVSGATQQFLSCNTGEALPYPFTIACRIKINPVNADMHHFGYGTLMTGAYDCDYVSSNAVHGGVIAFTGRGSNFTGAGSNPLTHPPANVWALFVAVFESVSKRTLYIDSSVNVTTELTTVPVSVATSKLLVLGGLDVGSNSIWQTYGIVGDVADAAIWNTAFTTADVDALAAGRPDDVKAGNLKGWWKLGEDGDLTSSAGTYGPMVIIGSCPVTPDPEYGTPVPYITLPVYSPRRVSYNATDSDAPLRDNLLSWYSGTRPFTDYWNNREGHTSIIAAGNTELREGQNNSTHNEYGDAGRIILPAYNSGSWVTGITYSFWIRVYTFSKYSIDYWNGSVMFYGSQADAGSNTFLGYHTASTAPYGYGGQLQFTRLSYYTPASFISSILPLDEWIHYSVALEISTDTLRYYRNGRFDTSYPGVASSRPDIPYLPTIQSYIHNSSAFGYGFGHYTIKDFRVYNGPLTADESYQVYQHSKNFHESTSDLIRTDIRPVRIEEKLDYIPGEAGVYELAGYPAGGLATRKITGALGAYLLQGSPTLLRSTRILLPEAGPYVYGGRAVALQLVRLLQANPGGYALEGRAATLTIARGLLAEYGIYNLEGMQADLLYRVIHAGGGRIFYVMREDRTLRIIRDKDVEG